MNGQKKTRILIAPLDWGLGHTTRCIPLIRAFQQKGCELVLAAEGAAAALLSAEFQGIQILELKGYGIRYSAGGSLAGSLVTQLPGILRSIRYEHQWLQELLAKEQFDFIISDNRPGLWSSEVPSIYITHQLLIHSGKGNWVNRILQRLHNRYMRKFTTVWVPDLEGNQNLAGELSHPTRPMIHPQYIGLLSRLQPVTASSQYDLMVLLSGPEPQRSVLESRLLDQLQTFKGSVLFVRGLPATTSTLTTPATMTVFNHLPAQELQEALASSKLILCRSGYTTLMDLTRLQKKAVLIPTPGQPEQEYLAVYMQQQSLFPYMTQSAFNLSTACAMADAFQYQQPFSETDFELHHKIVEALLATLPKTD